MQMPDVNVLLYAHHDEAPFAAWLTALATGPEPFALSELALQGLLRIATNPRICRPPSTTRQVLQFVDALASRSTCSLIRPGPRHWIIFRTLCEEGNLSGKIVADAAHAALAIESGCEWVTADTDFARFAPPLRWRHLK
jgi:uncharacterized protein